MERYYLRYQAMDLALDDKDFVVGRVGECDLVLNDALVSRRHARFRVIAEGVVVEDLGSRNGVRVNDEAVQGQALLRHGDRVGIGSQFLVFKVSARNLPAGTSEVLLCERCARALDPDATECTHCGFSLLRNPRATLQQPPLRSNAFQTLSGLADKALGLGRGDEAERILSPIMNNVAERTRNGNAPNDLTFSDAIRYALRLAEATHKSAWLDYVFELYTGAGKMMSADTVEDLYRLSSKLNYKALRPIDSYLQRLQQSTTSLRPNERFLHERLEGLKRRVASR